MSRLTQGLSSIALVALVAGCSNSPPPVVQPSVPTAASELAASVANARRLAGDLRFDAADSALAAFTTRFPGSPESLECTYWRALLKLDPSNPRASRTAAITSLDVYLADRRPHEHTVEAAMLRRVAAQIDTLSRAVEQSTHTAVDPKAPTAADVAASDAEIKRLKDELAKANTELERIKKRLAQPGKP